MRSCDVLQHLDISYRQLDTWSRVGLLGEYEGRGPGVVRLFDTDQVLRIVVLERICDLFGQIPTQRPEFGNWIKERVLRLRMDGTEQFIGLRNEEVVFRIDIARCRAIVREITEDKEKAA